jgi:antitoxin (DNA-binding transcriptional repressor) of toxin-antitoxin stability system
MPVFTYSETRQRLAAVLDFAKRKGEALIQRRDGPLFRLVPVAPANSPLDIEGGDGGVPSREIVAAIRESRSARDFDKFRALLNRPGGEAPRPGDEIGE